MMFLPARKTVSLIKAVKTKNHLKETIYSWPNPSVDYLVCGWWTASEEPFTPGHQRVTIKTNLITPTDFPAEPHDRVVLGGKLYEIDGWAQDYTEGPWWNPGVVVWTLTRIEGG